MNRMKGVAFSIKKIAKLIPEGLVSLVFLAGHALFQFPKKGFLLFRQPFWRFHHDRQDQIAFFKLGMP